MVLDRWYGSCGALAHGFLYPFSEKADWKHTFAKGRVSCGSDPCSLYLGLDLSEDLFAGFLTGRVL